MRMPYCSTGRHKRLQGHWPAGSHETSAGAAAVSSGSGLVGSRTVLPWTHVYTGLQGRSSDLCHAEQCHAPGQRLGTMLCRGCMQLESHSITYHPAHALWWLACSSARPLSLQVRWRASERQQAAHGGCCIDRGCRAQLNAQQAIAACAAVCWQGQPLRYELLRNWAAGAEL